MRRLIILNLIVSYLRSLESVPSNYKSFYILISLSDLVKRERESEKKLKQLVSLVIREIKKRE